MQSRLRVIFIAISLLAATLWPAADVVGARPRRAPQTTAPAPAAPSPEQQAGPPPAPPKHPVAQCLQDRTNALRAGQGLPPLLEIPALLDVAQRHSDVMASAQWLHHSTDSVFPLLPAGWLAFGENVVYGTSCDQMFEAFMGSDPHRDAMLRADFNVSGTAISLGPDGWIYATLVFLNLPQALVPPPSPPAAAPAVAPPAATGPGAIPEAPAPPPVPVEIAAPPTISLAPPPSGLTAGELEAAGVRGGEGEGASPLDWLLSNPDSSAGNVPSAVVAPGKTSAYLELLEEEPGFMSVHPAAAALIIFALESTSTKPVPQPSGMS